MAQIYFDGRKSENKILLFPYLRYPYAAIFQIKTENVSYNILYDFEVIQLLIFLLVWKWTKWNSRSDDGVRVVKICSLFQRWRIEFD